MSTTWIVTQLFFPEETSTAYIMTRISEVLSEKGSVNVICGTSSYHSDSLKTDRLLSENVNIFHVNTPSLNKNNLFFRLFLFFYFTIAVFFKIIRNVKKNDKLILVTNPPTLLIVIGLLKRIKKFNLIVILQDIFPENAAVSGIIAEKSFIYKFILSIMNRGYSFADKLIACGSDMSQHFIKKGLDPRKIFVIPNWIDQELLDVKVATDRNVYFNLDLKEKVVLEFAGNVGRVQGLERFLKLFYKAMNPNLILLIIGDGANKNELEKYVCENNISNVYFFKTKPRHEQAKFLNSCDVGLITLCEGMYGLGVPSKVYNLMSAAKPIFYIGDKNSEIDNYIKKNKIGWSFNWQDEKEILTFLTQIDCSIDFESIGINARNFAFANFTEANILSQYKELLT